jgi:PIN domain nuclease of toxin-antitoxin system
VTGFLLDTHALLWFIQGDPQLSDRARGIITTDTNQLCLSVASLWEMTIKLNIGKLKIGHTIDEIYMLLKQLNIEVFPIGQSDLEQYLTLPLHHRDPFDRLLIAQAIAQELTLVSADNAFGAYSVQQVW